MFAFLLCCAFSQASAAPQSPSGDDLEKAVELLQQQIVEISQQSDRETSFAGKEFGEFAKRVNHLSEQTSGSSLLTRAYLALAIAELELVEFRRCGRTPESACEALKEHAEAVEIAIDIRVLDDADRRVYQALRSSLRRATQNELAELRGRATNQGSFQLSQVAICPRPMRRSRHNPLCLLHIRR